MKYMCILGLKQILLKVHCFTPGLRGAIAFALSLHLQFDNETTRHVMVTNTLIIVLFTLLFLGGSTMPLMKVQNP